MVYNVIGITGGSSPDGLELVFTSLTEVRGKWEYVIKASERVEYTPEWKTKLTLAPGLAAKDYLLLNSAYGHFIGQSVNELITRFGLDHQVHFIAVYGFPVFYLPEQQLTAQLGEGGAIAAITGLPVISDLPAIDVALKGKGVPVTGVAERLLFPDGAPSIPFQEALLIALTGALRWRQETNALAEITGAEKDSVGGALWAI